MIYVSLCMTCIGLSDVSFFMMIDWYMIMLSTNLSLCLCWFLMSLYHGLYIIDVMDDVICILCFIFYDSCSDIMYIFVWYVLTYLIYHS